MNCFPDKLSFDDAGMRGSSRVFRVRRYYRYVSSVGMIIVPTGFLTDGASIPRIFWSIFSPVGSTFPAAVIHDFLYSKHNTEYSRDESDRIFKEAMFNLGIGWVTRETVYRAVRMFGGPSFKAQVKP